MKTEGWDPELNETHPPHGLFEGVLMSVDARAQLIENLEHRLDSLRELNDQPHPELATARLRGRTAEIRLWLEHLVGGAVGAGTTDTEIRMAGPELEE